ncbi:MAG: SCO family protein [Hyphomonadaceae bacterium]
MSRLPSARRGLTRAIVPALAAASVAALLALFLISRQEPAPPLAAALPAGCIIPPPAGVGGPFSLAAADGRTLTQADFAGRPALLYFGYTHCPDVCPVTLYAVKDALTAMGPAGAAVRTVVVSVDPERDSPQNMAQYAATNGFPPGAIGLSGAPDQVNSLLHAYGVTAFKTPLPGGGYNMSHTSFLYVMDQSWNLRGMLSTIGKTPQEMARCIQASLQGDGADRR